MRRFRNPASFAALALASYATVAAPAAAAAAAATGAGIHSVVAETHGANPRQHDQQHAGGPQTLETLKNRASHHLAEFGREMLATQHSKRCKIVGMGVAYGEHSLCAELKPRGPCTFYSYGIQQDYTFDTAMADDWGCKGVALDPSVTHPSKLHRKVTFHNIAARTMDATEDAQWDLVTTVPGLKKFLRHDRIDVLKMDCEGCEYALAQDILLEDPDFLRTVDQLAIEIHVSRKWLKTEAHAHHLGMLYALAKDSGLRLVETVFGGCHPDDEAPGCHPVLQAAGFPCQSGMMCNNLLFARV